MPKGTPTHLMTKQMLRVQIMQWKVRQASQLVVVAAAYQVMMLLTSVSILFLPRMGAKR